MQGADKGQLRQITIEISNKILKAKIYFIN